jgi:excisionase family DNA binding protein
MAIPGLDPNRPRNWLPGIGKQDPEPAERISTDRLAMIKARAQTVLAARAEEAPAPDEIRDEIPTNGPVTVSTLGAKDSSEPRDGSVPRKNADQLQTRTTTFRPSKRSRSSALRNDRAPASLGTESPVVEAPKGTQQDRGAARQTRPSNTLAGGQPDTLVDAAPEQPTDPGSTPGRSTEKEMTMAEWITTTEAAERVGVNRQKINNWVTWKKVEFKRVGRRVLVSATSIDAKAAGVGLTPAKPKKKAKPASKRRPPMREAACGAVEISLDSKAISERIRELASPPVEQKPRADLVRQLRALLEMHEVVPTFNIYELLRHVRAVVA